MYKSPLEDNLKKLLDTNHCIGTPDGDDCVGCAFENVSPCNADLVYAIQCIIEQEKKQAVRNALDQVKKKGAGATCVSIYDVDRTFREIYKEEL